MDKNNYSPSAKSRKGARALGQLIMQFRRLERHPHTFGSAGTLTPSEIHTIEAIGCEGGILMNELAARLEVTKGAVSQLVVRLEAKQLVERKIYPHDSRGVLISLTEKGKEAYTAHDEVHVRFYEKLRSGLSRHEIEIFETCIEKLNEMLKR
ncbi:MarR family winged helix-turn-helix transcriptional regulator [Paenibacillus harenae]|uniref:MarR family winged helix-turn-helix transcriptional regulator n=1 Tax=Paenibacillus harenae TaxID=306543 RepID=UPI00278F36C9|nr:MarR family transcriptional regulator [Paenibacillus harenae]MDQ0061727.1 DNA-binding MarR family transcriptional regulator [Paenibacillus harenae]